MRRLTASALVIACLPAAAAAQGSPTILDLLAPDRLVRSLAQYGIMALRTQMDVKYGAMDIDILSGRLTLSDVRLWPLPEWDEAGDCEVSIDRLSLRTTAFDELESIRFGMKAEGVSAPQVCFPPDAGEGFAMAGIDALEVPRLSAEVIYDVPSSGATLHAHAAVDGVGTADLAADMSYVWVDGRDDMEEPDPVVFLRSARLSVENDGIWQAMQGMLPPEFTSENAAMVVEGALGGGLAEMNDGDELTDAQRAFLDSVVEAWPAFLADPDTLVLETGIDGDVYIDFAAIEDDPRELFEALMPRVGLSPASAADLIAATLLRQALGAEASALAEDDQRRAGMALLTGNGAPRDIDAGMRLLAGLAEAGDGAAAMALSSAMQARAPAEAYRWALLAGAAGETGATARLDALEKALGLAATLRVQASVSEGASHDMDALDSLAGVREQAAMRHSGRGMARSYGIAAMWAMIGAAAGDGESAAILAEIDARARQAGKPGRAAWAAVEREASKLAMEAWLGRDLPAQLAQ